jgi:hypothetical protein
MKKLRAGQFWQNKETDTFVEIEKVTERDVHAKGIVKIAEEIVYSASKVFGIERFQELFIHTPVICRAV